MSRKRFMYELEQLLKDIPDSERKEAIQYYNDYFDDAGAENEARVIEELGSPAQVAKTIRESMSDSYTEYTDKKINNYNLWKTLCILFLCLLLSPVILPIGGALLVAIASVFIGILGIVIGAIAVGIAHPIAGLIIIGYGIYKLFAIPAVGIALSSIGCLILAVGILAYLLAIWIFQKILPKIFQGTVAIIRYSLRKAGIVQ